MNMELISLFNVFCIVVVPQAIWYFARLKSIVPCAVVQISLGIALGPSALGAFAPALQEQLLPIAIQAQINGVSTLSILFFALITGLHIDLSHYRGRHGGFAFVGFCSVFVPFCLGIAAAWWLYQTHPAAVQNLGGEVPFVLSTAIAVSVTALPVLGAILRELGLIRLPIGQWSLGLAAINDAALWLLMSGVLAGFASGGIEGSSPMVSLPCGLLYLVAMFGGVRPALRCYSRASAWLKTSDGVLIAVTAFTVISAAVTEVLGLHYILGAFIAGAVLPDDVRAMVLDRIEHAMVFLLAPFFFIATGLRVTLDFSSADFAAIFGVTTAAAIAGKFIGTAIPARGIGLSWRESLALGSLMQAKGMMELAVLTILLDARLISGAMFSALTVMAVVTTALVMPLTKLTLGVWYHPAPAIPE